MTSTRDDIVTSIARETLSIPTLQTRKMDDLDFHSVAVWSVKAALEQAYEAGRQSASPTRFVCPACGRAIEITPIR